jgi:hypothetical protein
MSRCGYPSMEDRALWGAWCAEGGGCEGLPVLNGLVVPVPMAELSRSAISDDLKSARCASARQPISSSDGCACRVDGWRAHDMIS